MIGQDTGHGEYGPNSAEVERFLALLERLTPAEWTQVEADAPTTAPSPSPVERAIDFSSGDAKRAGDVAAELAPRSGGGDLPARTAAEALVLREELGEYFTLYYQPFVG